METLFLNEVDCYGVPTGKKLEYSVEKPDFNIGDYVQHKNHRATLRSGCETYQRAVVASMEPFILISPRGDMLWRCTINKNDFVFCGYPEREVLNLVIQRLANEIR